MVKQARRINQKHVKRQYARHPSFADLLPFAEWSEERRAFLLEDGVSVGCLLECRDVSTEAKPSDMINDLHEKIAQTLSRVVPLEEHNSWVLQIFVQDDSTLSSLGHQLMSYIPDVLQQDSLTLAYLQLMTSHFNTLAKSEGLFHDPLSGLSYRGKTRRIRLALYRRYTDFKHKPTTSPLNELDTVCKTVIVQLQTLGIKIRRLRGKAIYEWFVRWFNPRPSVTKGNVDKLLSNIPYPSERQPFGWSFTQNCFFNEPESVAAGWKFDGLPHKVMVFRGLSVTPEIGIISREIALGDHRYSIIDKLPEGSIYTLQIIFESQKAVEQHLQKIEASAVGTGDAPKRVKQQVTDALGEIRSTNKLYRVVQALFYYGKDENELSQRENTIEALLNHRGLSVINPAHEVNPMDNYLRFLPFNFNPAFDKRYLYRSTYQYATDIAALFPLYGRARGDGLYPLHIFFNRGGEGFVFDHLNPRFKMSNSHMAIIGSTGAGKSVFLNMLIIQLLAVKNARVYVLEAGGSFDLTARYVASHQKSVNTLKFDRLHPIPVNPFVDAYRALEMVEEEEKIQGLLNSVTIEDETYIPLGSIVMHAKQLHREYEAKDKIANEEEKGCIENRDVLAEMALAVRTMVTGGLEKEEERFTLADDMLVMEVLIEGIKCCKKNNVSQVLTSHIIEAFEKAAQTTTLLDVAKRLAEMARAMAGYVKSPLRARFLNRPSVPFVDNDLTVVDLGFLQEKQHASMLSLVAISLLSKILAVAEANQHSDRPTILILDEAHLLFKNPLVATFVILMSKVARKIGLWLIPCTQNVEDFSSVESKKVLSMMETWICLALDKKEIANLKQFKTLTDEEIALLEDIKKYPGLYSEGVLLGARYKGLFRNVPPRFALALAMTEQVEKAERRKIMETHAVDELTAAVIVAKRLESQRQEVKEDEGFDD